MLPGWHLARIQSLWHTHTHMVGQKQLCCTPTPPFARSLLSLCISVLQISLSEIDLLQEEVCMCSPEAVPSLYWLWITLVPCLLWQEHYLGTVCRLWRCDSSLSLSLAVQHFLHVSQPYLYIESDKSLGWFFSTNSFFLYSSTPSCLQNYIPPESLTLSCPVCRQTSILPEKGVCALQNNFFITNLMEVGLLILSSVQFRHPAYYTEQKKIWM